ncbi:MAG: glutaredoxin 3 [Steroidobacteraceae bacterium]
MYVTGWCPYCQRARNLLDAKQVDVEEIDVESGAGLREEMRQRSGRNSVPQIFIGATHVGGFDDLNALDLAGKLDPLLKESP